MLKADVIDSYSGSAMSSRANSSGDSSLGIPCSQLRCPHLSPNPKYLYFVDLIVPEEQTALSYRLQKAPPVTPHTLVFIITTTCPERDQFYETSDSRALDTGYY